MKMKRMKKKMKMKMMQNMMIIIVIKKKEVLVNKSNSSLIWVAFNKIIISHLKATMETKVDGLKKNILDLWKDCHCLAKTGRR